MYGVTMPETGISIWSPTHWGRAVAETSNNQHKTKRDNIHWLLRNKGVPPDKDWKSSNWGTLKAACWFILAGGKTYLINSGKGNNKKANGHWKSSMGFIPGQKLGPIL